MDSTKDRESRKTFLSMFQWEGSHIEGKDREQLEQTIGVYNNNFARHRLEIGINNNCNMKRTPEDEVHYTHRTQPVPINLKEDVTVESGSFIVMAH